MRKALTGTIASIVIGLGLAVQPAGAVTVTESVKIFGFTIYETTTEVCTTNADGEETCIYAGI